MNDGLHRLAVFIQASTQFSEGDEVAITTQTLRVFCGVGLLCGLVAVPAAHAAGGDVPVQTLSYRVIDNQPTAVQQVGYRHRGYSRYGYGYRPRYSFSAGFGYRPSYYGYSNYRRYRSFSRAPAFGYSYYRPRYYGFSYYGPRYYGYPLYRAPYYGYSYYRPSLFARSYFRPSYYGSYYGGYGSPRVLPTYGGGIRYHGSYGYGSACCN